ncbi:uncharacterized protein LOC130591059 [Beta vulgaris subsp. vulgaris]|uniref:uncharacterized protein LOC130591059 n=1 Tax=Beta vulgaris subsp. vulgaris TaxID=3555 RepID=UPI002547AF8C|nr:uncharacterized protein LOC130591059 [Beta vulgaris subsp. vulgaris]
MGFRDLRVFNDALLGRQAWRLVREPHSLLARVMKAKYYSNFDFLDAPLGVSTSYTWSSIWSSKALLKEGMVWRIGNGTNVRIWEDPWLLDELGRFITSEKHGDLTMVSELIDFDRMEWKVSLIEALFNDRDIKCILSIPLSSIPMKDELTWAFTNDAHYSMEVSPKVKHFLWRLCTNTLPVRSLLKHRHMLDADECPRGCGEPETQSHAIFGCPFLRDLWVDSGCERFRTLISATSLFEGLANSQGMDEGVRTKGAFLAWVLWSERNALVFNAVTTPPPFCWRVWLGWWKNTVPILPGSILLATALLPQAPESGLHLRRK